jgi:hypothetical protein
MDHVFVGHMTCPGFEDRERAFEWWNGTSFHVPCYDYFREGWNYQYTPVDFGKTAYTNIDLQTLDRASRRGRGPQVALVYRDPLEQAASFFRYSQAHRDPLYNTYREIGRQRAVSRISVRWRTSFVRQAICDLPSNGDVLAERASPCAL